MDGSSIGGYASLSLLRDPMTGEIGIKMINYICIDAVLLLAIHWRGP